MNDGYAVKFNSNDINEVPGVWLYNYTATDLPERDINIHKLARRSLSIVTSAEYTQKVIPVLLKVCSGDRQDTEATLTEIKGLLQAQNGTLEVLQSDRLFQYTATMNEFNIEWQNSTAYVQIIFLVSTPVAEAATSDTLFSFSSSLASDGVSFDVDGSYEAEPLITVTLTAVTGGGSGSSFSVFNATTSQGITIWADDTGAGTFSNGDIIEINSSTYEVLVNGAATDFTGIFPVFPPGLQRVGYTDTFTTRTKSVSGQYNVRVV